MDSRLRHSDRKCLSGKSLLHGGFFSGKLFINTIIDTRTPKSIEYIKIIGYNYLII